MTREPEDGGGPAFPVPRTIFYGMSLRDYFAGQALAAFAGSREAFKELADMNGVATAEAIATCAYELADAMLAEREK